MKNKSTGITKHVPRSPLPKYRTPGTKKSRFLFWLAVAGILGLLGGGTYLLWPMPDHDPFGDLDEKAPPKINSKTPPGPAPAGMVWIPGGEFWMGDLIVLANGVEIEDALPIHKVYVDGFWMDQHEVTNEKWSQFVNETGYLTIAEKKPDPRDLPNASPEELKDPCSAVFTLPKQLLGNPFGASFEQLGWAAVKGACWKHPEGKTSTIAGKEKYPVVHIAHVDAVAYCRWLSKKTGKTCRLPTEAEWEFAARGGLDRKKYSWGEELTPGGKWMANIWQGDFPNTNTALDGFTGLAPVGSFPPNGYGLHDMSGNAWEWCNDYYHADYYAVSPSRNPRGPATGIDPSEPNPLRVRRGGSYLCSDNYCIRYLVGARDSTEEKSAANHIGFRCICEAK